MEFGNIELSGKMVQVNLIIAMMVNVMFYTFHNINLPGIRIKAFTESLKLSLVKSHQCTA